MQPKVLHLCKGLISKKIEREKSLAITEFEPRTSGLQSKSLNNHFPNWNMVPGKYNLGPKKPPNELKGSLWTDSNERIF